MVNMAGKRRSKKRDAILELMRSSTTHPGAQWVYEKLKPEFPDLSLGTVYRNISLFRKEGLASFLGTVNGEERYDGITAPHPHVCCTRCGVIKDLDEALSGKLSQHLQMEIPGFTVDIRNTVFYGLCTTCRETAALGR